MQVLEALLFSLFVVGALFGSVVLMAYGAVEHRDGAAVAGAIVLASLIIASRMGPPMDKPD